MIAAPVNIKFDSYFVENLVTYFILYEITCYLPETFIDFIE